MLLGKKLLYLEGNDISVPASVVLARLYADRNLERSSNGELLERGDDVCIHRSNANLLRVWIVWIVRWLVDDEGCLLPLIATLLRYPSLHWEYH